ncbi:MAG: universal stress protein [Acidimicrobiales bacterium]
MRLIVVGVDGSKGSRAATVWAAAQAAATGAEVLAVYVVRRTEILEMAAVQVDSGPVLQRYRDKLAGVWTAPLRTAKVRYRTRLVRGDPAAELLRCAQTARADLIVIGMKKHSALHELALGGTAHKVANRATRPVTLVPAGPPRERAAGG